MHISLGTLPDWILATTSAAVASAGIWGYLRNRLDDELENAAHVTVGLTLTPSKTQDPSNQVRITITNGSNRPLRNVLYILVHNNHNYEARSTKTISPKQIFWDDFELQETDLQNVPEGQQFACIAIATWLNNYQHRWQRDNFGHIDTSGRKYREIPVPLTITSQA